MAQPSVTSFFKRKAPASDEKPKKKPQTEIPSSQKPEPNLETNLKQHAKKDLSSYSHGNKPDDSFFESKQAKNRHNQFVKAIGHVYRKRASAPHKRVLKPFDLQYIGLKSNYKDTLLIVEVGYKYKLFGRDAAVACKLFGWTLIQGWLELQEGDPIDALYDRFAVCSFPTARLGYYLAKLVNAGHKVAVVNQTETSALKAAGSNKSGPFKREVSAIYTKGTFIDALSSKDTPVPGHIVCIARDASNENKFAIVCAQPTTGHTVYDEFEDSKIVTELETRILHIEPSEILCVGDLGVPAKRLVDIVASRAKARVTRVEPGQDLGCLDEYPQLLSLNELPRQAAAALVKYLKEFNLDQVFGLNTLKPFSLDSRMILSGNTLVSLEIFQTVDGKQEGSLFRLMDHTRTQFGKRRLREWVAQPLLSREQLSERHDAVFELVHKYSDMLNSVRDALTGTMDLEKALVQVHYNRISRKQCYYALRALLKISRALTIPQLENADLSCPLLIGLLQELPKPLSIIESSLKELHLEAKQGDALMYFANNERLNAHHQEIKSIDAKFDEYIEEQRTALGIPLKYTSIASDRYLIEVDLKHMKKLPADWQKINGTKAVARFYTSRTHQLVNELALSTERLQAAADQEYKQFVSRIAVHYTDLQLLVSASAELDCLMALAALSTRPGYVRPEFVDERCLEISEGRNPIIDEVSLENFIPNDTAMYKNSSRAMIITGPNMGGKSSYVRQVALIAIMAQVGSFVPARSLRMSLLDAIYTRMGAYDNMMKGESTFMVELKECREILEHAGSRSLVILDEIGRGTSTTDGMAIAYAVLDYFVKQVEAFTLFITHYPLITELALQYPKVVTNWCLDYVQDEETKNVTFLYKLSQKVAFRSYGLNVARLAAIPSEIITLAGNKSQQLEEELSLRRQGNKLLGLVFDVLGGNVELVADLLDDYQ